MASTRVGTLLYMAPEILNGQSYNHRADIWSLGCVLYELCTLKRPFQVLLAIASGQYEPLPHNIHPLLAQCVPDLLKVDPLERALGDCIMERYKFVNISVPDNTSIHILQDFQISIFNCQTTSGAISFSQDISCQKKQETAEIRT